MKPRTYPLFIAPSLVLAVTVVVAVADSAGQSQQPRGGAHVSASLGTSRQALLVLTDDWNATTGALQRFERRTGGLWRAVGSAVPVVVGRNGLAWGVGMSMDAGSGPIKKEGDGKAPAGIFRLGTAFGQSRDKPSNLALPYRYLADDVECVDDVRSSHYNDLVTKRQVGQADWTSSEKMWAEPLYKRGVVIEYNTGQPQSSGGSCIFLHIWKGPKSSTAGCTAMAEPELTGLMAWLDESKRPVLIQLPRGEYMRLRTRWNLPHRGRRGRDPQSGNRRGTRTRSATGVPADRLAATGRGEIPPRSPTPTTANRCTLSCQSTEVNRGIRSGTAPL